MKFLAGNISKKIIQIYHSTDLVFLAFLLLFLNIKLPIKLAALVFIYALRFNFKFGLRLKGPSRLPLFYLLMAGWCCIELLATGSFQSNYLLLFSACTGIWLICFLAMHQIKLAIEKNGVEKVERSLRIFFIMNAIVSLLNLLRICFETHSINPYTYEGLSYKYFTSTGDYIRGILFDVCTANMIINAMGIFYFLHQKRYSLTIMCLCVALLTTSNLGNLILVAFTVLAFFTHKNKAYKSMLLCCLSVLVIFMVKVSPANLAYSTGSYKKLVKTNAEKGDALKIKRREANTDSLIRVYVSMKNSNALKKEKMPDEMRSINQIRLKINSSQEILSTDTSFDQYGKDIHSKMLTYTKSIYGDSLRTADIQFMKREKSIGKLVSFQETGAYLVQSLKHFLFGAGPGNFSSKFAFRALGLNTDGQWLRNKEYMSDDFKNNHLKLWLYYEIQPPATHSTLNFPNSVANQLAGEYGLVGLLIFLATYVWYFLKRYKILTYGRLILFMLLAFLFTDYWFENLSILIIFETMMLLDLHKKETETA